MALPFEVFGLKYDVFNIPKVVPKIVVNSIMAINSKYPNIFDIAGKF